MAVKTSNRTLTNERSNMAGTDIAASVVEKAVRIIIDPPEYLQ